MAFTEVILTANISSLGAEADIVKVRRGYARNFLLPNGKALEINSGSLRQINHLKAKRAEREARGLFIAEGLRELSRAIERKVEVLEIYFCPSMFRGSEAAELVTNARVAGVDCCELGVSAFEKVSGREGPDGLLGVARTWNCSLDQLKPSANPLLLVAESVEKPGNLGALLRTADSAGCDALIVCDPITDVFNPNVVRSSQGALFSMPVAVCTSQEAAAWMKAPSPPPTSISRRWRAIG